MPAVIRAAMYAYHVNHSTGTCETEAPDSLEMTRRWEEVEARGLPWLVAEETPGLPDMPMLLLTGAALDTVFMQRNLLDG
jgi:hypothetical protein